MVRCFKTYDTNGDMSMDAGEFKKLMEDIGEIKRSKENPNAEVFELLKKYDENKDGVISWPEFVEMMITLRGTDMNFGVANELGNYSVLSGGTEKKVS